MLVTGIGTAVAAVAIHPDTNQSTRLLPDRPGETVLMDKNQPPCQPIRVRVDIEVRESQDTTARVQRLNEIKTTVSGQITIGTASNRRISVARA